MNEATAKRWIADLPLSSEDKSKALDYIAGKTGQDIKSYLVQLRQKSGSRHYMNKKTSKFAIK
jgi:hypothetical protein